MASETLLNDVVLMPFLMAQDPADAQHQLALVVSTQVEARIRAIISVGLSSDSMSQAPAADLEDLSSEVKTRLVAYLQELKANPLAHPCRDFRAYVARAAHNACRDYFRQLYPARARLDRSVRYLLENNSSFAIWRMPAKRTDKGEWVCGFDIWRGGKPSSTLSQLIQSSYVNTEAHEQILNAFEYKVNGDLSELVSSIFKKIGEPIRLSELVNLIAEIQGIKEGPNPSLSDSELDWSFADPTLRIDHLLELREPLTRVWRVLRRLPRNEFKAYLLYARDTQGDDLINLFLDAKITTSDEIAVLLEMTHEDFDELRAKRLPLDNEAIAEEVGVSGDKVYKLRHLAARRVKGFLNQVFVEKTSKRRKKSTQSPSHD